MEATVEAVCKGAQIAQAVLGIVQGIIGAAQAGLEVTQYRVDPEKLGEVFGFAITDDGGLVLAPRVDY